MRKLSKILSVLLAATLCFSTVAYQAAAETTITVQSSDKTWTMSSHSKTTSGSEYTKDFVWDGLSISATSAKTVSFDGTYLKLSGGANTVQFGVKSACDITVVAKNNSNSTTRYIINSVTNEKTELPTSMDATTLKISYKGSDSSVVTLTPYGGGISIKSISIKYPTAYAKGDVNNDGSIDSKDAATVLRHISSGIGTITEALPLAAADPNADGKIDMLDVLWILNYGKDEETKITVDTSNGTEVKNYTELVNAVKTENATVYIMNDIDMEDRLYIKTSGVSLIGVPDENNALPVLNFENMTGDSKTGYLDTDSSDSDVGIKVNTSNVTIKNLIVEKAHDNGIQIKGTDAKNNVVENCIVRYNNDSGIQVTGGATNTILKCVYSYRNCDVYTRGSNADGFAIKLSAGPETTDDEDVMKANGNFMIDCYSWDNGDDGWDSFDYPTEEEAESGASHQNTPYKWTYWNEYENCMGWNNGNPETLLGYTDYANGLPLDENLTFMIRLRNISSDKFATFKAQYEANALGSTASEYYSYLDNLYGKIASTGNESNISTIVKNWKGNPNCFKLGSRYTRNNSQRYLTNCIAFDHQANGVDKNNSGANIYAENIISFNNKKNYHLEGYTAGKWTNIYGWDVGDSDGLPTGGSTPSSDGSTDKEAAIRSAAKRLVGYAENNKVIASNIFNNVF